MFRIEKAYQVSRPWFEMHRINQVSGSELVRSERERGGSSKFQYHRVRIVDQTGDGKFRFHGAKGIDELAETARDHPARSDQGQLVPRLGLKSQGDHLQCTA